MKWPSLFLLLAVSCSTVRPEDCNYDYGYARGVNDARANLPMDTLPDKDRICYETGRREMIRGYREGYSVELRTRPAQAKELARGSVRNEQDLYVPECRMAYGERVCGYGCITIYGQIRCARNPGSRCLAAYGDIRCGQDCEVQRNRIECSSYE